MYTRILAPPARSTLLLGPRGVGKSTWIRQNFPDTRTYDLLNTSESLRLSREPGLLAAETGDLKAGDWIVIDEVQKVPALLDEVHRLIERRRIKFLLCGSSARKLRSGGTNLLAGRALMAKLFPLVSVELGRDLDLARLLRFGSLPSAVSSKDAGRFLTTYAETYLQEEIRNEALVRNIGSFSRFLEIAARQNAQITNIAAIARDAQTARPTVQGYFEILVDTLAGDWLNAWKLKRATKQVAHPKFYFFDAGVVRALSGRIAFPPLPEEEGFLLETVILHELRAFLSYHARPYPLHFWRSHDGVEVDFFIETPKGFVAIEVKAATRWDHGFEKGLRRIREEMKPRKVRCFGVCRVPRAQERESVIVLPVRDFLKRLWVGEVIPLD